MSKKPRRSRSLSVADFAADFARSARSGERPRVRVQREYVELFLGELVRAGLKLASACIDEIKDPELREIIRTLLFSTAAGALLGAALGSLAGPPGAKVGAAVGAGLGCAAGVFAVLVTFRQEDGPNGPALVVEAGG